MQTPFCDATFHLYVAAPKQGTKRKKNNLSCKDNASSSYLFISPRAGLHF
jgi:hypothetical protein